MQQYGLQYASDALMDELLKRFNIDSSHLILQFNFKNAFEQQIKNEIKEIIFDITGALVRTNNNWEELIKKYTQIKHKVT